MAKLKLTRVENQVDNDQIEVDASSIRRGYWPNQSNAFEYRLALCDQARHYRVLPHAASTHSLGVPVLQVSEGRTRAESSVTTASIPVLPGALLITPA